MTAADDNRDFFSGWAVLSFDSNCEEHNCAWPGRVKPFLQTHTYRHIWVAECTGLIGNTITGLSGLAKLRLRLTSKEHTWLGVNNGGLGVQMRKGLRSSSCLFLLADLTDCWITESRPGEKQLLSLSAASDFTSGWMPQWGKNFELRRQTGGEHEGEPPHKYTQTQMSVHWVLTSMFLYPLPHSDPKCPSDVSRPFYFWCL